jgi:hypothetical protein
MKRMATVGGAFVVLLSLACTALVADELRPDFFSGINEPVIGGSLGYSVAVTEVPGEENMVWIAVGAPNRSGSVDRPGAVLLFKINKRCAH